jgi:hypothetical protein
MYSSLDPQAEQSDVKVGGNEASWNGSSSSASEPGADDVATSREEDEDEVCMTPSLLREDRIGEDGGKFPASKSISEGV